MRAPAQQLKPLKSISLSAEEGKMLAWLKNTSWEAQKGEREPIPYQSKVPEFYGGVRLYRVQASGATGGAQGPLELFLKKLEYQGIISKQGVYPLAGHGISRLLSLTRADLDNLGVGQEDDEE